jgi:hypothetical protein
MLLRHATLTRNRPGRCRAGRLTSKDGFLKDCLMLLLRLVLEELVRRAFDWLHDRLLPPKGEVNWHVSRKRVRAGHANRGGLPCTVMKNRRVNG